MTYAPSGVGNSPGPARIGVSVSAIGWMMFLESHRSFARDEVRFVCAVLVGSVSGVAARLLLSGTAGDAIAEHLAVAVATTFTGAAHARLVHRRRLRSLIPVITVGVPLAYLVMRGIHLLAGV